MPPPPRGPPGGAHLLAECGRQPRGNHIGQSFACKWTKYCAVSRSPSKRPAKRPACSAKRSALLEQPHVILDPARLGHVCEGDPLVTTPVDEVAVSYTHLTLPTNRE